MAVPVPLDFIPPQEDNIVKLHIYESSAQGGPFSEIELVTEVGTWPNYIDHYTTANATALDDWFAIQWEDDKGAKSVLSSPVKGGTDYLVREVMSEDEKELRRRAFTEVLRKHNEKKAAKAEA